MTEISISKFKATCLGVLERVRVTGESVTVTKHGKPIAVVSAPKATVEERRALLGYMKGTGRIVGDIVGPTTTDEDWDALKP